MVKFNFKHKHNGWMKLLTSCGGAGEGSCTSLTWLGWCQKPRHSATLRTRTGGVKSGTGPCDRYLIQSLAGRALPSRHREEQQPPCPSSALGSSRALRHWGVEGCFCTFLWRHSSPHIFNSRRETTVQHSLSLCKAQQSTAWLRKTPRNWWLRGLDLASSDDLSLQIPWVFINATVRLEFKNALTFRTTEPIHPLWYLPHAREFREYLLHEDGHDWPQK